MRLEMRLSIHVCTSLILLVYAGKYHNMLYVLAQVMNSDFYLYMLEDTCITIMLHAPAHNAIHIDVPHSEATLINTQRPIVIDL